MASTKTLTFEAALKRFKSATTSSMKYARICAEMALREFASSGNISMCQQFLDAMPKNYTRKSAFIEWLVAHSPAELIDGKLRKDPNDTANAFNLEGATAKPFWDFAPERPVQNFSAKDVIEAIHRTVKKFENSKKYAPATPEAAARLATIKAAVENLDKVQPANTQAA